MIYSYYVGIQTRSSGNQHLACARHLLENLLLLTRGRWRSGACGKREDEELLHLA